MTISLLLIATGKYDIFLQSLIDSVDQYFFRNDHVNIYLFTDKKQELTRTDRISITFIPIEHKPFPFSTLYRYKYFDEAKDLIKGEYVFYCDVDMKFVAPVGREILGDIVCVKHPGFYRGGWGSTGCTRRSLAYLPVALQHDYMAGGFQGGRRGVYLDACNMLSARIADDEKRGVMAEWHDETHFNWYLKMVMKHPKVLDPSYCYPESWTGLPFKRRILALDKDHDKLRS